MVYPQEYVVEFPESKYLLFVNQKPFLLLLFNYLKLLKHSTKLESLDCMHLRFNVIGNLFA